MDQATPSSTDQPIARLGVRHLFVRDLVVDARIGVYDHEKTATQRVRLNMDLAVEDSTGEDRIEAVVSYEPFVIAARQLALEAHSDLVETLAEKLAAFCLQDRRVMTARIRVEKLDVFEDAGSVGVEIERRQNT
ncbi:MAG: dihydroneopterin aldolase [Pseudomonadota bacterium]